MMRKCFALFFIFLQVTGPAFASVLTVEDVSVIGAAADDYYGTGSKSKLKIIDGGNIGRTMVPAAELSSSFALSGLVAGSLGIAGIAYYERTGQDPIYAAASAVASAADAIFTSAYQAFKANFVSPESFPASAPHYVGLESAVGATIEDLTCAVNDAPENYPVLKAAMDENYTPGGSSTTQDLYTNGVSGLTFYHPDGNLKYGSGSWVVYANSLLPGMIEAYLPHGYTTFSSGSHDCYIGVWESGYLMLIMTPGQYVEPWYKGTHATAYYLSTTGTPTGDFPSFPASDGAYNYPGLKSALSSPSPSMAEEMKQAIQNMPTEQKITSSDPAPTQVPAPNPSPITNNQIQNFFTENTANVYNEYLETVTNNITNPGDIPNEVAQAAAETAKAQEEEANKESEETFSSISSNPFEESFNPGEFDIPTRFTTFLNNVKSSGLFSLSSAFFESLPGGGSPVFEINGGETFGTHTIDLNDTFTGGLAVVKSVLLALFGFLSIRAIILKR